MVQKLDTAIEIRRLVIELSVRTGSASFELFHEYDRTESTMGLTAHDLT